jgi:hypothetical protein
MIIFRSKWLGSMILLGFVGLLAIGFVWEFAETERSETIASAAALHCGLSKSEVSLFEFGKSRETVVSYKNLCPKTTYERQARLCLDKWSKAKGMMVNPIQCDEEG